LLPQPARASANSNGSKYRGSIVTAVNMAIGFHKTGLAGMIPRITP